MLIDYKFLYVNVCAVGSECDGGVFAYSQLGRLFNNSQASLSPVEPLPRDSKGLPIDYVMMGDDAFAIKTWMMKPFPKRAMTIEERVFNYRLSWGASCCRECL